jgi:hypothetical protein
VPEGACGHVGAIRIAASFGRLLGGSHMAGRNGRVRHRGRPFRWHGTGGHGHALDQEQQSNKRSNEWPYRLHAQTLRPTPPRGNRAHPAFHYRSSPRHSTSAGNHPYFVITTKGCFLRTLSTSANERLTVEEALVFILLGLRAPRRHFGTSRP